MVKTEFHFFSLKGEKFTVDTDISQSITGQFQMFALLGEEYSSQVSIYPIFLHSKKLVGKAQEDSIQSLLAGLVVSCWWLPPNSVRQSRPPEASRNPPS